MDAKPAKGKKSRGVEKTPRKERVPTVPVPGGPRAEERARAATLAKIVDAMIDPVFVLDFEGRCVSANRACSQMFGLEPKDFVGKSITEMPGIEKQKPEEVEKFMPLIREAIERGSAGPVELVLVLMDGREITLSLAGGAIKDAQGNPTYIVAVLRDITELKRAEEALRESEERFRDIAENALEWIWEVDAEGKYTYSSPVVEKILGYKPEEVLKKHFYDLFHPEDREDLKKAAFEVFAKKQPFREFINRNVRKNGKTVWFSTSGVPILDEKGNLLRYRGADTDITERKRVEERLRASENKYRTLLENLPQKIFFKDRNSVYISCNENYARDRKIKPEEIVGKTDYDFYPKELAEQYRANDKRVVESGKTLDIEEKYIQEGQEVITRTIKTPVKDEQGNIIGALGIFWDITERKRAEEELVRLSNAVRMSTDSIVISDLEGNIIDVNKATLKMYGTDDKRDLIGKNSFDLIAPEDREKAFAGMKEVLEKGDTKGQEYHIITKDGSKIPVEMNVAIMKDANGKPIGFVSITRDITERKRAEEERLKATADRQRIGQLEKFARIAVGRELKMIELKKRIKALESNLKKITGKR